MYADSAIAALEVGGEVDVFNTQRPEELAINLPRRCIRLAYLPVQPDRYLRRNLFLQRSNGDIRQQRRPS